MTPTFRRGDVAGLTRLIVSVCVGLTSTVILTATTAFDAPLAGWALGAGLFVAWTWIALGPMNADDTAAHASREEPSHGATMLAVIALALVSLGGVVFVLLHKDHTSLVVSTLAGIVASWAAIHTIFAVHYARIYFTEPVGGIDFHQDSPPVYSDFAYVGFTVGMSFAISDTDLGSSAMRRPALAHALLSYLFGTVIVALLVNLVAGL
ncbi:hypothetical protein GOEFS_008_00240 [Gordonia effusa NBRC 100432]|uniref:DUF1345 domain-containing protein n=1 Tax=Gordonia effusa NBRC 100432 TaxID=1077974 RepID=H0QUW4_9ACTN|nr:DUF1345 domain-containing protein [Gordonia effusa]GAB16615.1 hypothetical protein GOEFS_008_00240 [Gordonia effusa NBRC 100432]